MRRTRHLFNPGVLKYLIAIIVIIIIVYTAVPNRVYINPIDLPEKQEIYVDGVTFRSPITKDTLNGDKNYANHLILERYHAIPEVSIFCNAPLTGSFNFKIDSKSLKIGKGDYINGAEFIVAPKKKISAIDINYIQRLHFYSTALDMSSLESVLRIGNLSNFGSEKAIFEGITLHNAFINAKEINFRECSFKGPFGCRLLGNSITFNTCNLEDARLQLNALNIFFRNCYFGKVTTIILAQKSSNGRYLTRNLKIDQAVLENAELYFDHSDLKLSNTRVDSINTLRIGDALEIDSLSGTGKLKLVYEPYKNRIYKRTDGKLYQSDFILPVVLKSVDTTNLVLPDYGMHFIVDTGQSLVKQENLYKFLLRRYADNPNERQKYDIAYQKFTARINHQLLEDFLKEKWNNYGYDKVMIFNNAVYLMFLFFIVNIFVFPAVLFDGYYIKEFDVAHRAIRMNCRNPWIYETRRLVLSLFYTFFVFWGIKLNIENIKIYNVLFTTLILIEYVTGIVCLAYIANIVIGK